MGSTATITSGGDAVLFAVIGLTAGSPDEAVLVFPSAASADSWARREGLDDYRVVPTRFAATTTPVPRRPDVAISTRQRARR